MSLPHTNSPPRPPRYTLRHLGIIVAAYVVYGVLLFGSSTIIAGPDHARIATDLEPIHALITAARPPDFEAWLPDRLRPRDAPR